MPTPAYIICSRTGAIDRDADTVHCFEILETIKIRQTNVAEMRTAKPDQMASFRVVAVWHRDETTDQPGQVFEAELAVRFPDREGTIPELVAARYDNIEFATPIHRLLAHRLTFAALPGPGLMLVESRIRRKGDTEWVSRQTFSAMLIEVEGQSSGTCPADHVLD